MTQAHCLLAELATRGVSVSVEGTHLRLRPRSALTESLIERILAAKPELLRLLRTIQSPAAVPALVPLQWWVLWAVAQSPQLPRAALYACLPAPRSAVDLALGALLRRGELRAAGDGALDINAS
jgi:hypothetical protein